MNQAISETEETNKNKATKGSGAFGFSKAHNHRLNRPLFQFSSTQVFLQCSPDSSTVILASPVATPSNHHASSKARFCLMLIFLLLIRFSVAAGNRPFPPVPVNKQASSAYSLHSRWESKQQEKIGKEGFGGVDTVGSRPPICDHKCGRCVPCEPTQVPTTTDHFGIHYSNYEPEGWKCKCGASLYNP